jgi:transcriptional regulator with XRE-family HTH domain
MLQVTMVTNQSFGRRVKALRIEKGLTQKELAERTGRFDGPFISHLEAGHVEPCLQTLAVLSRALGVTMSQFFEGLG